MKHERSAGMHETPCAGLLPVSAPDAQGAGAVRHEKIMKIKRDKRVELLAPAGSFQSVVAAVNAGADAVYMGGRRFGARAYADSAQAEGEDMVMEAIRYCHLFSVKLYMTVNILFKDDELKELFSYIKPYYEAGVDGLIMQDLGAVRVIRSMFPDLEVHASTQQTITSVAGARMAQRFGMTRAVVSRELSLQEIRKIHDESGMELEVFCHGAMCYSYSGACFMSSLLGGRSGNRGRCAGTCRLCYETAEQKGYYLSMKDMQTIEFLPELIEAGAYSFKIEGRMKSPVYTAGVVSVYRKYLDLALDCIDRKQEAAKHTVGGAAEERTAAVAKRNAESPTATVPESPASAGGQRSGASGTAAKRGSMPGYRVAEEDLRTLREIFDRGGTSSYLKKHNGADMIALSEKKFRAVDQTVTDRIQAAYIDRNRTITVDATMDMTVGAPAVLTLSDAAGRMVTAVSEDLVLAAEQRPIQATEVEARLRKTGGTAFTLGDVQVSVHGDAFYPVGKLNELRRMALAMYEEEILRGSQRTYAAQPDR